MGGSVTFHGECSGAVVERMRGAKCRACGQATWTPIVAVLGLVFLASGIVGY